MVRLIMRTWGIGCCLLLLLGCTSVRQGPTSSKPDDATLLRHAEELAKTYHQLGPEALNSIQDTDRLVNRVLEDIDTTLYDIPTMRADYRNRLDWNDYIYSNGPNRLREMKVLGLGDRNGMRTVRIRISQADILPQYWELLLEEKQENNRREVVLVDGYFYYTGQWITQVLAQSYPTQTDLETSEYVAEQSSEVHRRYAGGDCQAADDLLATLPERVRHSQALNLAGITCAALVGDSSMFQDKWNAFHATHIGEAACFVTLLRSNLPLYFARFDTAFAHCQSVLGEKEAGMYTMKGYYEFLWVENDSSAIQSLQNAISLEPDYFFPPMVLGQIYIALEKPEELGPLLSQLVRLQIEPYDLDQGLIGLEQWTAFKQSSVFEEWNQQLRSQ